MGQKDGRPDGLTRGRRSWIVAACLAVCMVAGAGVARAEEITQIFPELSVDGLTKDGRVVPILREDAWQLPE